MGFRRLRVMGLFAVAVAVSSCAGASSARGPVNLTIATAPGERLAFVPAETIVSGPGRVEIQFRNAATLPHNLVFVEGVTGSTDTIVEPGTTDAVVVELEATGSYRFVCTIHEGMAGRITVAAASAAGAAARR